MINSIFKNYEESILKKLNISYSGLNWCELGNQTYSGRPAKVMYTTKGVNHTSIDINGRDGSLPLDLDCPVPKNLENKFDVITNYGTTEHVNNQYAVFKNIHVMCKVGCIVIHGVPLIGHWRKHCRYYYSIPFFEGLAAMCNYTIIYLKIFDTAFYAAPKNLISCVFKKEQNTGFPSSKSFASISGIEDSGDLFETGNYTTRLKKRK